MARHRFSVLLASCFVLAAGCKGEQKVDATPHAQTAKEGPDEVIGKDPADLILYNAEVYTMNPEQPWANVVVIRGNQIVAVLGKDVSYKEFEGPKTKQVDLGGKLVVPGFVDTLTHFTKFGAEQNGIYLMEVNDSDGLRAEVKRVSGFVPEGEWITGGRWGKGKSKKDRLLPDRWMIDSVSSKHPCLLESHDGELYLANTAALQAAGLSVKGVKGMKLDSAGRPTGLIYADSPALKKVQAAVKPKSESRIVDEIEAGLRVLAQRGITELHDVATHEEMLRYAKIREKGDLSVRIWGRPHLLLAADYRKRGVKMNTHPVTGERDRYLRVGAFKGHYDGSLGSRGALLKQPYDDKPETSGRYRECTSDDKDFQTKAPDKFFNNIKIALEAGFDVHTHAIGSGAVSEVLDDYQKLAETSGKKLDHFRVIHAEVVAPTDLDRFKSLGLIADVNPYSVQDDMGWLQDRLGPKRVQWAFPFQDFLDRGVRLTFGSDVPGDPGLSFSNHPAGLLHGAVYRTKHDGKPEGGWIPEQKISMHEALRAHTQNGAYAVYDDDVRGVLGKGMLADLAVCNVNIVKEPSRILEMDIDMTVVDGQVVFDRSKDEVRLPR